MSRKKVLRRKKNTEHRETDELNNNLCGTEGQSRMCGN